MNMKRFRKGCMIVLACYIVLAVGFYWIAGDQLRYQSLSTDAVHAAEPVGELVQGMNVRQPFIAQADELSAVSMLNNKSEASPDNPRQPGSGERKTAAVPDAG